MHPCKLALAQYPISSFDSLDAWKTHVRSWVADAAAKGAVLLVFPEYGSMELTSLFDTEVQANLHLQLVQLQELLTDFKDTFRLLAQQFNCTLVAPSFPVRIGEKFVNRAYVFAGETESFQDKWFMTRFENEEWGISSTEKVLRVFETAWGAFGIQICYDGEFPIGAQLLAASGVDLIVAPSCTETIRGATRVHIGARARAMEQQIYVGVAQTIQEALWSPAVDINYGYAAIYASPDKNQPEEGIVAIETPEVSCWLIQELDFERNKQLKLDGQVFNFKDSQLQQMELSEIIRIERITLC